MAKNYLSGITLQIGGDTSQLSQALKVPNQEANELQQKLKAINTALKLDPTNTDLLAQKQELLGDAIEKNEERMKLLKKAQEQFISSGGDLNSREYIELEKQIAVVENQIKKAKDQQTIFKENIVALGVNLDKIGTKAESFGKKLLPASGAMAALGAYSTKTAIDFEDAMSQAAGALDMPMDKMGDLRELALQTGQDTIFSATEAGQAITELAKGGLTEAQIQGGALATTMDLAASSQMDLATSANVVVQAMGAFHLEANQSAEAANALAGAAAASSTDVEPLTQGLAQCSAQAYNAGWSIQETTAALALFADAGVTGSDAGTSLKTMLQRLAAPTDEAAGLIEDLGIQTRDSNGELLSATEMAQELQNKLGGLSNAERDAALQTIFGSDATRAATIMMNAGADGLKKYTDATNDQEAAARLANSQMSDWSRSLEELQGSLETAAIVIGDKLAPIIAGLADAISGLVDWFSDLDPTVQNIIVGFGAAVAAAGPLLIVFGKMSRGLSSLIDFTGNYGAKLKGVATNSTLAKKATDLFSVANQALGGHLGLVAVGAAALVGGIAALTYALTDGGDPLYRYAQAIDDARASLDEMEIAKQEIISQAEAEAQTYQSMYDQLESLVDANGRVRDGYEAQAEALANELNAAIGTNIELVDGQIQGMQEAGEEMDVYIEKMRAQAVIEAQAEQMKQLQELYNQNVENLADMNASIEQKQAEHNARVEELRKQGLSEQEIAQDNLVMLYQAELDTYSSQKDEMLALMSETEGQMQTYYTNLGLMRKGDLESLKQINASHLAEIDENGNLILETQKRKSDELQAQIEAAQYQMTQTTDEAERARLQSTIDSLEEQKQAQVEGIQAQASAVASGAYSIANEWKLLANKSLAAVKVYDREFYSAGKNSALGYANGISAYASVAVGAVKGLSSMVVSALKKSLDIHSPSRLMEDLIGKNIVLGIADGIEENENAVLYPLNTLAKKMTSFNLSPDFSGQINKSLHLDNSITVTSPIQIDLDGKPIYQNVVTRITRTQGMRSQFKGGYG